MDATPYTGPIKSLLNEKPFQLHNWETDYETVRDAIVQFLDPYDDDSYLEPQLMVSAVKEAAAEIRRLRDALENCYRCARRISKYDSPAVSQEQSASILRIAAEALPEDTFSVLEDAQRAPNPSVTHDLTDHSGTKGGPEDT